MKDVTKEAHVIHVSGKDVKNGGNEMGTKYRMKATRVSYNVCDTCGKETDVSIILLFTYGSDKDGEGFDFCSDECFKEWIKDDLKLMDVPIAPIKAKKGCKEWEE